MTCASQPLAANVIGEGLHWLHTVAQPDTAINLRRDPQLQKRRKERSTMALQAPTPAPMTNNSRGPSRIWVLWRRVRFAARRDPLATLTSPPGAIRLADELLARTAIAHPDTEIWCSVAVRPLAALLDSASPAGTGGGIGWLLETLSGIEAAEADDTIWDHTQAACNRPTGSLQLRTALPWLRGLDPRQRDCVTRAMRHAVDGLH